MKDQSEYTDEDRLYGAWLAVKDEIRRIDSGRSEEDFPGHRQRLFLKRDELETSYRNLTGESIKQG